MLILFLELSDRIQQERAYHTAAEWFVRLKIGDDSRRNDN